jgi:hypothetical protein
VLSSMNTCCHVVVGVAVFWQINIDYMQAWLKDQQPLVWISCAQGTC